MGFQQWSTISEVDFLQTLTKSGEGFLDLLKK